MCTCHTNLRVTSVAFSLIEVASSRVHCNRQDGGIRQCGPSASHAQREVKQEIWALTSQPHVGGGGACHRPHEDGGQGDDAENVGAAPENENYRWPADPRRREQNHASPVSVANRSTHEQTSSNLGWPHCSARSPTRFLSCSLGHLRSLPLAARSPVSLALAGRSIVHRNSHAL